MSNPSADRKKCFARRLTDSALLLSVLLMPHSLSKPGISLFLLPFALQK